MDIGGGTSNLALIRDGKIIATGCLNVGGRLLKFDGNGKVIYVSPVLEGITDLQVGDTATPTQVEKIAKTLVEALEMAAGLREPGELLTKLTTEGTAMAPPKEKVVVSFSGGVADCIQKDIPWLEFGDMGPILGRSIRGSRLCGGAYTLGSETIRATVIGAGCHSAQLSGSTVFYRNMTFPLKNLPVICLTEAQQALPGEQLGALLRREREKQEGASVLALPGIMAPSYSEVVKLAEGIAGAQPEGPVLICLEQDMAKALGQALAVRTKGEVSILCIDRIRVGNGTYLDIGAPIGPAMPVVVKTLILGK
jgi:ethanolamine utilization protein EutA